MNELSDTWQINQRSRLFELFVDYSYMFLLVIASNTLYNSNKLTSARTIPVAAALIVIPVSLQVIRMHKNTNYIKLINFYVSYFLACALFVGLVKFNGKGQFISTFLIFLPVSILYVYARLLDGKFETVVRRFVNTVVLVALISIIFWMLFSNLHLAHGKVMFSEWAGSNITNYFWVHFDTQQQVIAGKLLTRNTSIFPEAPMYAYLLLCALLSELYIRKNLKVWHVVVLFGTIVTTMSTTGIVFGAAAILLKIVIKNFYKFNLKKMLIILPVLVAVLGIIGVSVIHKTGSSSGLLRNDDLHAGYVAWKKSPLIGNGFGNMQVVRQAMGKWRWDAGKKLTTGFTAGIAQVLNDGGIYLLLFYLMPVIKALIDLKSKRKNNQVLIALLFILGALVLTIEPYTAVTIFILSISYVYYFIADDDMLNKDSNSSVLLSGQGD